MTLVRLSDAAISALECAGLELDDDPGIVARCWTGKGLTFAPSEKDDLFSALTELSNSEDNMATDTSIDSEMRKFAGRAARALATVASKVIRSDS